MDYLSIKQDRGPQLNVIGVPNDLNFELHFSGELITPDYRKDRAIIDVDHHSKIIVCENGELIFRDLRTTDTTLPDSLSQSDFKERRSKKLLQPNEEHNIFNINEAIIDRDKLSKDYSVEDHIELSNRKSPLTPAEFGRYKKYRAIADQEVDPILVAAFLGMLGNVSGRGEGHGDVQVFGDVRFQLSGRANIQVKILPSFSEFLVPSKKTKSLERLVSKIQNTPNGAVLFIPTKNVTSEMCLSLKHDLCCLGLDALQVIFLPDELLAINGAASFEEVTYKSGPGIATIPNSKIDRKLPWALQMQQSGSLDRIHSDPELSEMLSSESKARIAELEDYLKRNYNLVHTFNT